MNNKEVRQGFSEGLVEAGKKNSKILAISADVSPSVKMDAFKEQFPDRFIEVGIAEQNMITVASGLAHSGYIPFAGSFAVFNPGRNWEQIRTTVCLNRQNVKIIGSHAGLSAGKDGATHQSLEDIALMRVLPSMTVIVPGDFYEAKKATVAIAKTSNPTYLRTSRAEVPVFTKNLDFEIGKSYKLKDGNNISLFGTGIMSSILLEVANELEKEGILAEVIHFPTVKPIDSQAIIQSANKTKIAISAEEASIFGGFGSSVAEVLAEHAPTPLKIIGMNGFGQTGSFEELMQYYQLDKDGVYHKIKDFVLKHKNIGYNT